MVAYPDRGEGNDPEPFFFFFFFRGMGSLSQTKLNIFTLGNMRVMICLGQGGLRSLSASSCLYFDMFIHVLFVIVLILCTTLHHFKQTFYFLCKYSKVSDHVVDPINMIIFIYCGLGNINEEII